MNINLEARPERGWLRALTPQTRLGAALAISAALAFTHGWPALAAGLLGAGLLAAMSGLGCRAVGFRLLPVNGFMLMLILVLPWSTPGAPLWAVGPLTYTHEGLMTALRITLRANAIVLTLTALLGAMPLTQLGAAMRGLGAPQRFTSLFLLSIRYLSVLYHEFERLRLAQRARAFRPSANRHTLHVMAQLTGLLIVRAMDRADRVLAAMRCRGFTGTFPSAPHRPMRMPDFAFTTGAVLFAAGMLWPI